MTKKQIIKIVLEKLEQPEFRKLIANIVADRYMESPKDDKKVFKAFINSLKDEDKQNHSR